MKKEHQDASLPKIILVANLYYKNKFSQQQISNVLHISRPWVSKLLTRAEEMGIVEIHVNTSVFEDRALSEQLRRRYGLQYACAVDADDESSGGAAAAAANYFLSQLQPDSIVSVGWGKSIARVIANLPHISLPDVRIIPMAGSFGTTVESMPNYSAIEIAHRLGGSSVPLHAPAMCTQEEYQTLYSNPMFSDVLTQSQQADLFLTGIGVLDDTLATRTGIFTEEQTAALARAGAIGDLALNFFDENGVKIETELTKRLICTDYRAAIRNARNSIVYAEGANKVPAIRAALKGKWLTSLITSAETARALL